MFTKQEIIDRAIAARTDGMPIEAELAMATVISACSLFYKKQRSGEDYIEHPLTVSTMNTRSRSKRIIGMLHDVIEDSDWTLDDLRYIGFSERIVKAVDGVTKRPNEKYLNFIVRCGQSGKDAIDVKINDLKHNMDGSRYRHIFKDEKQRFKEAAYNLAHHYLVDLKKFKEDGETHYNYPGTSMVDYIKSRREYASQPAMVNHLLEMFSSETDRLPLPPPVLSHPFPGMG